MMNNLYIKDLLSIDQRNHDSISSNVRVWSRKKKSACLIEDAIPLACSCLLLFWLIHIYPSPSPSPPRHVRDEEPSLNCSAHHWHLFYNIRKVRDR